jgi:hypothetical protein
VSESRYAGHYSRTAEQVSQVEAAAVVTYLKECLIGSLEHYVPLEEIVVVLQSHRAADLIILLDF